MVFNDTSVIRARLFFRRITGAKIEVFCLEPCNQDVNISDQLQQKNTSRWTCMVGNKDKWKHREELELKALVGGTELLLRCRHVSDEKEGTIVEFEWNGNYSFGEVLEIFGHTPIPPYLGRPDEDNDIHNYQTIYALRQGAVAAPTAGFHFTPELLKEIKTLGIPYEFVTLHVGAGTFQPVKVPDVRKHQMHTEQLVFSRQAVERLAAHKGNILCVGTTSLRALESLYWYGRKLVYSKGQAAFNIESHEPYTGYKDKNIGKNEALEAVMENIKAGNKKHLVGHTSIFIYPGYQFNMCDHLVTNFHLPQSTLLMLIAAFVGENWKKIYSEAIDNNYRFLSYGDSSVIFR
jgi:S-adenosylmethionine:tRNA ribosyltransferase-isomerase